MTSTQMQSVRTSVSQLLYRHAVLLCRDAAAAERRSVFEESVRLYGKALVLLEVVLPEAHERDVSGIQRLLQSLEDRLRHARAQTTPRGAAVALSSGGVAVAASPTLSGGMARTPPSQLQQQHHGGHQLYNQQQQQPIAARSSSGPATALHAYSPAAAMAISPPTSELAATAMYHSQPMQQYPQPRPPSRTSPRVVSHAQTYAHGVSPDDFVGSPQQVTDSISRFSRTPSAKHSLAAMDTAALLAGSPPVLNLNSTGHSPPGGLAGPKRSPSTRNFKASFCGNCGAPFSSEDQRFCTRCGWARVSTLEGDPTA